MNRYQRRHKLHPAFTELPASPKRVSIQDPFYTKYNSKGFKHKIRRRTE